MQISRPPAVGHQSVVAELRSVLFSEPILGAVRVRPKGYKAVHFAVLAGWWAPKVARRATEPLPATVLYLAVTPVDLRLFSKPPFGDAFEIGRWKRSSYRASAGETRFGLRLDLELERIGPATVFARRDARPVFDLVVQGATS